MKQNSFKGSLFIVSAFLTIMLMACQKEQNATATTDATPAASENNIVAGVNGGAIPGLISRADADELRAEYIKVAGTSETQSVQFFTKLSFIHEEKIWCRRSLYHFWRI